MFTQIFKCSRTIERHLAGPLVEPRLRYLTHYAEQGAALDTLQQIADSLLVIAEQMNLSPEGEVRREEIIAAADRWAGRQPRHPSMTHTNVQRQLHFHRRQLEFPFHFIKLSASPRVAFYKNQSSTPRETRLLSPKHRFVRCYVQSVNGGGSCNAISQSSYGGSTLKLGSQYALR